MTGRTLMISAAALAMLMACTPMKINEAGGATEQALCDVWQDSLPSRSRSDTQQTIEEIGRAYDQFQAACQREVKI
jgi:hypothetical protein